MRVCLVTSPHLNHAAFQEGVVPLGSDAKQLAQTFVPMGLLSLAEALGGIAEVQIADINKAINNRQLPMSNRFYEVCARWLLEKEPDVLGFMTEADSYHHILRICQAIKDQSQDVITLLGGPHASAVHETTLVTFPAVDFVIRGEGETALRALIASLPRGDLTTVGNLSYRLDGRIAINGTLPLISDLDTLPWPDYSRLDVAPDDGLFLEIGRGCPFSCNFCFTAPYWQRKHRIKSAARIIREIRHLMDEYQRTDFNFTHDLFTTNRRWVLDFCRQLSDTGLNVTWTCSSRTDTLDEEQIFWMKRAGCRNIYFGVETGTPAMQKMIDKNLDLAWAHYVIEKASASGIGVTVGFIAGLPGETTGSLRGTLVEGLRFLRLPDATVHLFGFSPYRGSAVYERIKDEIIFDPHFVDFPLGAEIHSQNCSFMRDHLGVFSRYSWMADYEGLDLGVVRAAEEFFPIVNAVRPLMLIVAERLVDPLDLLQRWSDWIAGTNRQREEDLAGLYRGTIADFLTFLPIYLTKQGLMEPLLEELVQWEVLKNQLRIRRHLLSPEAGERNINHPGKTGEFITSNGSLALASFRYAPLFAHESRANTSQTFAFYCHSDGTPAIVRVSPIAAIVLELARPGVAVESVVAALSKTRENESSVAIVLDLIDQLRAAELLALDRGAKLVEDSAQAVRLIGIP